MSVELMTNMTPLPPPPPPPLPKFNVTTSGRLPVSTNLQVNNNNKPLVNFQTNGNTNNNFSILCDEIKNGVKLKKCPVNSDGIAKNDFAVNNGSRHTRSSSLDGNIDNQVVGDNKDPKMVSVQAELMRRLQRRNDGVDDENQEQKILSPTLAMFVQNKTKPLKRDEAQEENSPKMISHAKRNFTVNRKMYSNGVSNSLQSSPNSSEMDLTGDKSLSHTDLPAKFDEGLVPKIEHTKIEKVQPIVHKIEPDNKITSPPPIVPIEPIIAAKIYKPIVKNSSPTPFVIETTPPPSHRSHEITKPLNITISSYTNKSIDYNNTPKVSPQINGASSPGLLKSPINEHIPAEEKASKKVSELCKNYNSTDSNTKTNDNFVHLNGNLTLKRPKQLPQTNQKISHGKPNYITQSSTAVSHSSVAPKSPIIHKTEVSIQPMVVNEQKTGSPIKNQNFLSFSKELSSSPNRYTDKVVTTTTTTTKSDNKSAANIMADLQQKQFIKDLIVDDLLEVKNIQFSIDPEKNDITIDLKIGMHLNPRNLN